MSEGQLTEPANATFPPEKYRFIPGTTQAGLNISSHQTKVKLKEGHTNSSGYFIEDETEPGLTDLQTLFLACFATLVPLFISLVAAFGIRILWRRYKRQRDCKSYDCDLHAEDSSEPLSRPLHAHLLNSDQIKCSETQLSLTAEDVEIGGPNPNSGTSSRTRSSSHSNTNGSIITMTLKNNHLIVETEERNDLQEDSRETTMKYSPGARDGIFVVEVQQGVRRSSGSGPSSGADFISSVSVSDQHALVHNPPDRYSDEETLEECDENEYYPETLSPSRDTPDSLLDQSKTGLSQSDLSLATSSQTYRYGNQQGYDCGSYGYPSYNGYVNDEPLQLTGYSIKPKVVSEVLKTRTFSRCNSEALPDGPLSSDLYANRRSKEEEDPIQEEQNRLGNSES